MRRGMSLPNWKGCCKSNGARKSWYWTATFLLSSGGCSILLAALTKNLLDVEGHFPLDLSLFVDVVFWAVLRENAFLLSVFYVLFRWVLPEEASVFVRLSMVLVIAAVFCMLHVMQSGLIAMIAFPVVLHICAALFYFVRRHMIVSGLLISVMQHSFHNLIVLLM